MNATTAPSSSEGKTRSKIELPGNVSLGLISSLITVAGDLASPLQPFVPFILTILAIYIFSTVIFHFVSHKHGLPKGLLWPIVPLLLCITMLLKAPHVPAGQPNPGAIAGQLPVVEAIQANILPISSEDKQKLQLEVTLKSGDQQDKILAIQSIPAQGSAATQKYLYKLVMRTGDLDLIQVELLQILKSQTGKGITIELLPAAKADAFSQSVDGSYFTITEADSSTFHISANIGFHPSGSGAQGKVSEADIILNGSTSFGGNNYPYLLRATENNDLDLVGDVHFIGGGTVPMKIRLF